MKDFEPRDYMDFKQARRMSRFSQFAVAAAAQAIEDSELEISDANRDDIAVVINTGGGGIGDVALGERVYLEQGGHSASAPSWCRCSPPPWPPARSASRTACAARWWPAWRPAPRACRRFIEAQRMIEHGDADVVIAGGTESAILPVAFAALANMGALSKRNDDPAAASRPFDADRDGFVFGEASAVLVVESAEHAERRGAPDASPRSAAGR